MRLFLEKKKKKKASDQAVCSRNYNNACVGLSSNPHTQVLSWLTIPTRIQLLALSQISHIMETVLIVILVDNPY